jgi:hypothetical protein
VSLLRPAIGVLSTLLVCASPILAEPAGSAHLDVSVEVVGVPSIVPEELAATVRAQLVAIASQVGVIRIVIMHDGFDLDVDGRHRWVPIADWSDPLATRTVVLHATDLAQAAVLSDLPAPPPPMQVETRAAPARSLDAELVVATRAGRGVRSTDPPILGLRGEVAIARGRWRWGASVGWDRGLRQHVDTFEDAAYDEWPVALSIAARDGRFELGADVAVAPYSISGHESFTGARFGAGACVRARLHIGGAIAIVEAGADAWQKRVTLTAGGMTLFSTPRLAPFVAIGVAWSAGP